MPNPNPNCLTDSIKNYWYSYKIVSTFFNKNKLADFQACKELIGFGLRFVTFVIFCNCIVQWARAKVCLKLSFAATV